MKRIVASLALACALMFVSTRAEAQLALGGLLGWGVDFKDDNLNRFDWDFGARLGYTLSSGVYVGGTGLFHVGQSATIAGVDTSWRMLQLGGELGYDIGIGPVIVRPYLGVGVMVEFVDLGPGSNNATDLYLNYGATVLYPIKRFFVGGDMRFATVFADETFSGFMLQLTTGYAWGAKPHDTGVEVRMKETKTGTAVEIQSDHDDDEQSVDQSGAEPNEPGTNEHDETEHDRTEPR